MTTPNNFRVKNGLSVANGVTVSAGNVVITGGQLVIGATAINATSLSAEANNAYTNAITIAANASNLTSGTVAIARIPTADSVSNTSISHVPTANNVKTAYDAAIAANTLANTAATSAGAAYTNAVSYTDTKIGTANTAMVANADAAYTNATIFAANASNANNGTLAFARLPSLFVGTTTIQSTSAAQAVSGITTLAAGNTTITGDMTVSGNLTISGTTTNIDSTNLLVEDKNIILGDVATPSDATADGGGITLKGATDKTFNWIDATDSWTASEHIDLAAGKTFKIGNTTIANSTALGTGIVASSLTSVGTLSSLTLGGAASGITTLAAGNTTITGFANVTTTIQGGSSLTIAGAASGITTLAAGNTTITGFANVSTRVNSAILSVGSSFIANSTGVTSTGFGKFDTSVNSAIFTVGHAFGSSFIANSTQVTLGSDFFGTAVRLSANGSVGAAGQVLSSNGSVGSPYWANFPETEPTIQAVASGILGDGSAVVLNANGTVSFVGQTMGALSSGASAEFLSTEVGSEISAVYDSSQERVVIAYRDGATGKAKVGTVSGNTISFGTAVQFSNATFNYLSATYDTAQQRVVITYSDSSAGKGKAIVGTVSNTSISFGTEAEFDSSACNNISYVSTVYDTAQQKTVTIYKKNNNNTSLAIVGTVSNTSISFGTAVEWANSSTYMDVPFAAYSPTSGKVVVAYRGESNVNGGTAIVGTVSGNSISFGTPATFNTSYTDSISAGYDNTSGRVVIAYRGTSNRGFATVTTISGTNISFGTPVGFTGDSDTYSTSVVPYTNGIIVSYMDGGNSYFGTARTGTVTGKSISFGDPVVFESANSTGVDSITSAFHSAQNKIVVASRADTNDRGRSSVLQATAGSTNLTSNNFIGFSSATYANGATAVIQIAGAIDDAQSGLSSGQSYYVQPNGGLGLTANSPSVFAGTTASENRIIVKGFSSDAKIVVGLGNTSAPSYTFTGDTDTGMFSPAANTLAFSTAGTEVARLTSAGYLEAVYSDDVVALGNTGATANIDLRQGTVFTATLTANCTFTLQNPNANANRGSSFTLILTNDATASRTVAWAGGAFRFPGGAATLSRTTTANAVDIWVFFTPDNGTTYYGNISMKDVKA